MSIPQNNIVVQYERVDMAPFNLNTNINQGDMLKWDSVNKIVTPVTGAADATSFCGLSGDTNPIPSLNEKKETPYLTLIVRAQARLVADDTQSYFPGDWVTISGSGDAQKITKVGASAGNGIGTVALENQFPTTLAGVVSAITAVQGVTKLIINIKPQVTLLYS